MCGFFGIQFKSNIESERLEAIEELVKPIISIRGPDSWESVINNNSMYAAARLEIRGNKEGQQPVTLQDNSALMYNGEIYNFKQLNANYDDNVSDTKHLSDYIQNNGLLSQLDGMFAFAIHSSDKITLVRDRLGIKPLFYVSTDNFFAYSSDARCFFDLIDRKISTEALALYLAFNYIPGDEHLFQGIKKVKPGHQLIFSTKDASLIDKEYSDIFSSNEDDLEKSFNESLSSQERLGKRRRGIYFSGGMDSTLLASSTSKRETSLFHIKFNESKFSEYEKASEFAKFDNRPIQGTEFSSNTFLHELPNLCSSLPSPLADPGHFPLWYLNKWISKNTESKYFLSGDGADELFCGYQTMAATQIHQKLSLLPGFLRKNLSSFNIPLNAINETKVGIDYKINKFISGLEHETHLAHFYWRNVFHPFEINNLLESEFSFKNLAKSFTSAFDRGKKLFPNDQINALLYADIKTWLVDNNLFKVDHASSTFGLEARVPYLSNKMVTSSFALRGIDKFRFLKNKPQLRNILSKRVPKRFLRNKSPFHPPYREWFERELHQFTKESLSNGILATKVFEPRNFKRLLEQIFENERTNSFKIYNLLILEYWLREHL